MELSQLQSVVLVGAGQMGMAMALGWLKAGLNPKNLVLVDPNPRPDLKEKADQWGITIATEPPKTATGVLVLAVKPQIADIVLNSARSCVDEKTLVLSVMAGISAQKMSDILGTERIARTMPNTPAKIGEGAIGAFAGAAMDDNDKAIVDGLLAASGQNYWVEHEADMDAVTGVSGSGPAYVFHMVEALAAAGEAQGLKPELALALARQTIVGAASLLKAEPSTSATQLRENVTSPNGTTFAGLEVLMGEEGLKTLLEKTVAAAAKRSRELGSTLT